MKMGDRGPSGSAPKGRRGQILLALPAAILVTVAAACTSGAEEVVLPEPTIPTAIELRRSVVASDGSPIPGLVNSDLVDAVVAGDADSCSAIDDTAGETVETGDFLTQLDDLTRAYPTPGATLAGEINQVTILLERCLTGQVPSAEERQELNRILEVWAGELS